MGFCPVVPVDQNIPCQPIKLAKKGNKDQTFFAHRDGTGLYRIRHGNHVVIVLVIANINAGPVFLSVRRNTFQQLNTKHFMQFAKRTAKSHHMAWIAWSEQTVDTAKNKEQYRKQNNNNSPNNREHSGLLLKGQCITLA
ncbi:protein of unknown function [Xenorhabdus doucetiae]|uniref:Uncharacterized protein n=1 Tax=Xenorhabdus doucetiae TaxID=351671 RepID=A0A068QZ24_9GAMM|nr:protein of unknown function [Xenorhabdus doucetiae]